MDETTKIELKHHSEAIDDLKDQDEKQWAELDKIKSALTKLIPVWVGGVLTLAGLLTGSALTFAGVIFKFAKFT